MTLTRIAGTGPLTIWLPGQPDPVAVQRAPAGLAEGDEVLVTYLPDRRMYVVVAVVEAT